MRPVQPRRRRLEQRLDRQRRFTAARNPRHTNEHPQRKFRRHVLQVVPRGPHDHQLFPVPLAPHFGNRNLAQARQIQPCHTVRIIRHMLWRPMADHFPAMHARTGAHVEHIIRLADRVLVMFHHQHGIARIAQPFQRGQQAVIIPLVQPDAGLIQHIQHARQPRTNLRGKPNTLRFPPRQRPGIARQRQVFQPHIVQKP